MSQDAHSVFGSGLSTVNARRSLTLTAFGAVAGLLLAGYALFTARGTSTLFVPPEDVAIVNQQPISRVDYLLQLQALYGVDLPHATREQRDKVLNDMVREELFVQRGKELDVALSDPEVRSAMVNAVELEIAADAISSQPEDAKLLAYYKAHETSYASEGIMRFYNYACDKPAPGAIAEAQAILRRAPPSTDSLSGLDCKAAPNPGTDEYYFAAKIHLGERLFAAARELQDGQVSAPIESGETVHLLYMVKNSIPVPQTFAAARDHVLNDFRKDAISRLRAGDESYLRKRANILIAEDMR